MWTVLIHPLVVKEDFQKIPISEQQKIIKAVRKKLTKEPELFGKPLRGSLQGFWRSRVADYRVIYFLKRNKLTLLVVKVGIRRDAEVYEAMARRLKKL